MMLLAAVSTCVACTPPPVEPEPTFTESIELMSEGVTFEAVGAEPQAVEVVLMNCDEWDVAVVDADWLTVEKIEADSVAILLTVADNTSEDIREAVVYVSGKTAVAELNVTQFGYAASLEVSTKELEFAKTGGKSEITVTANVEWEATTTAEWLTLTEEEGKLVVTAAENNVTEERKATIKIDTDYSIARVINVTQEAGDEPARVRDNQACFVPYTAVVYEGDSRNGYGVENMFDNDLDTYWSCPNAGIEENAVLTFVFDGRYRVDYMEYFPSPDYGQWGEISISYKKKGASKYTTVGDYNLQMKSTKSIIEFSESLQNVAEIVIEVKTAKGRSTTKGLLAGATEVEFFYNDDVYYNAVEVFEDESCSVFRNKDFSTKDLAKIQDETIREIAEIMLNRTAEDNEFRAATYKAYPNPQLDADRFLNAKYSKYDNVTGMLLLPGQTYTICVSEDFRDDVSPKLVVINYKTPKTKDGVVMASEFNWDSRSYTLRTGVNEVTIPENKNTSHYGGLCYIEYMSTSDITINVNFIDGYVNGYFDVEKHSPDRWESLLAKSIALEAEYGFPAHFDMRSPRIVMSFPSSLYQSRTKTGERAVELIGIYNEIIEMEEDLQGHKLFNTGGHRNRMHMVGRYGGSYMYATDYHTGYNILAAPGVLDPDGLRASCWGAAHEFGHVNQIRPILKWVGTTEVTNNIMSAYVQWTYNNYTVLGNKTSTHGYNGAMRDLMARGCSHVLVGSWDAAYYLKVVPFFQLYLYFTEIKGMKDFYPTIHNTVRNYPDARSVSDEEAMLRFCELVSDLVQLDMTEFFERWGFLTPVDVWWSDYGAKKIQIGQERIDKARAHMAKYPKPTQPIHFISEANMHLFEDPAANPVTVGKVVKTTGTNRYHFQNWENCVAYIVEGSDGKWYAVTDASAAYLYTKWNEFQWGDEDGNINPAGGHINSKEYYCTVGSKEVNKTEKNTPALESPKFYGVGADGTFYEPKN